MTQRQVSAIFKFKAGRRLPYTKDGSVRVVSKSEKAP